MKKSIFTFILSTYLAMATPLTTHAQPGSLDVTFGSGGIVTTNIGISLDHGRSVAIQNDGKILLAGYSFNGTDYDFALVRYKSDGILDDAFGSDGKVTTAIGSSDGECYSVAIQDDDKIVLAGYSFNGSDYDFALVRYNSDGSLDDAFGSDGIVTTDFESSVDYGKSVAIDSNGRIVVAGSSFKLDDFDFAVARYNTNGSLDSTFDYDGKTTTAIESYDDGGNSLAIQSDGKIVVAGYSQDNGSQLNDFALVRYNNNGSLDSTFSFTGKVTTDVINTWDEGCSIAIQSDNKIVLAGYTNYETYADFALLRYNTDGTLDPGFGSGGKVITPVGNSFDYGNSVALQDNKKIVVAGYSYNGSTKDFALVRYNSDGSLDTTLESDGKVTTDFESTTNEIYSVAIQEDGKIVVAGSSNFDFAIARYNAESVVGIVKNITVENAITLSPNPFSYELLIEGTEEKGVVTIFDITGKEISRQKTLNDKTKVNTQNILPGFYLVKYVSGNNKKNMAGVKF